MPKLRLLSALFLACSLLFAQKKNEARRGKQYLLLFLCIVGFTKNSFSQKGPSRYKAKMGTIDSAHTTREQILTDPGLIPRLIASGPNSKLKGFELSILTGDNQYLGPYTVTGGVLTEQVKNWINKEDVPKTRVFIENIKVEYDGKITAARPLILTYDH